MRARRILATVNVVDDLGIVGCNELGLSETRLPSWAWTLSVAVAQPRPPSPWARCSARLPAARLTREDFGAIVRHCRPPVFQIELTAFVVACHRQQSWTGKKFSLTDAMVNSGRRLDWHEPLVVDKYCASGIQAAAAMLVGAHHRRHTAYCAPKPRRAPSSPAGVTPMECLAR